MSRAISYLGLLIGLLILSLLIIWQGVGEIFGLLLDSGFLLLLIPIGWIPGYFPAVMSWRLLFPLDAIPSFKKLLLAIWVGRAINTLLPVATIGGEIAKARLMILWGEQPIIASASVMVDKTVQALAIIPWALIGAAILYYLDIDNKLAFFVLLGTILLCLCITGFVLIQKAGMFGFVAKTISKFTASEGWEKITLNAHDVDTHIKAIYHDKKRFFTSIAWRTFGLILQTAEVWLACYLLGNPISMIEALMLRSLISIITDIAFMIPNGYGIQEGGFIMLGTLIGLTPEFSLAVSLATRIRDFVIDLPGLLYWHQIEAKHLLNKNNKSS